MFVWGPVLMDENLLYRFSSLQSWSEYSRFIPIIASELTEPIFRGQGNECRRAGIPNSGWALEPSLYRFPRTCHPQFIQKVKVILADVDCRSILTETLAFFPTGSDEKDRLLLIGLMRHFGIETPLLDWTKNPFVAAFFAFNSIHNGSKTVSIFLFDQKAWLVNKNYLTSRELDIIKLIELDAVIARQQAQQSIYTYSRNRDVYGEFLGDESEGGQHFIATCSLPSLDRPDALRQLGKMGVTSGRLFPDIEKVEKLKGRLEFLMRETPTT